MTAVPGPAGGESGLPTCDCDTKATRYPREVFHPGHGQMCPRYIPNMEHFCVDCGVAVNYAAHRAWCPLAAALPAPVGEGDGDLEAVLAAHEADFYAGQVWCMCDRKHAIGSRADHAAHVAEQIRNHLSAVLTDAREDVARGLWDADWRTPYDGATERARQAYRESADAALAVIAARVGVGS